MATIPASEMSAAPRPPSDNIELAEILLDLAERAQAYTNAAGVAVALIRGSQLLVRTSTGSAPEVGTTIPMSDAFISECVRTRKPITCRDVESDSRVGPELRSLNLRSLMAIPVCEVRDVKGMMLVIAPLPNSFQPTHISILMTLSDIIAAKLREHEPVEHVEIATFEELEPTTGMTEAVGETSIFDPLPMPADLEAALETAAPAAPETFTSMFEAQPAMTMEKAAEPSLPAPVLMEPMLAAEPASVAMFDATDVASFAAAFMEPAMAPPSAPEVAIPPVVAPPAPAILNTPAAAAPAPALELPIAPLPAPPAMATTSSAAAVVMQRAVMPPPQSAKPRMVPQPAAPAQPAAERAAAAPKAPAAPLSAPLTPAPLLGSPALPTNPALAMMEQKIENSDHDVAPLTTSEAVRRFQAQRTFVATTIAPARPTTATTTSPRVASVKPFVVAATVAPPKAAEPEPKAVEIKELTGITAWDLPRERTDNKRTWMMGAGALAAVMLVGIGLWMHRSASSDGPAPAALVPRVAAAALPAASPSAPVATPSKVAVEEHAAAKPSKSEETHETQTEPKQAAAPAPVLEISTGSAKPKPETELDVPAPKLELASNNDASIKSLGRLPVAVPAAPKSELVPAELLSRTAPTYPAMARQAGIRGAVVLKVTISKDGSIGAVNATDGPMQLRQAATEAVKQWRYKPATLNGRPIETSAEVKVNFTK